jgi:predicted nucleotidyltransferase
VLGRLRESALALLRERPDVLEVRLFGSLARGDALPGSDADLLVILRDPAGPFLHRAPGLASRLDGAGIGCDIIAYTASELARLRDERNAFVARAFADGIVLARRTQRTVPSPTV